jgi:trehalose utilization protein
VAEATASWSVTCSAAMRARQRQAVGRRYVNSPRRMMQVDFGRYLHERKLVRAGRRRAEPMTKIFRRLMGTSCSLKWRIAAERERLWVVARHHPIARGLPECFELATEEMYGEPFAVPEPLETVFISWFAGGEVFRSGLTYRRGAGKVFYFRPGHETYPTYHDPNSPGARERGALGPQHPQPRPADITSAPTVAAGEASEALSRRQ